MINDSIFEKYTNKHSAGLYPVAAMKLGNKEWDSDNGVVITNIEINTNVWGEAGSCIVEVKLNDALDNLLKKEIKSPKEFSKIKPGIDFEVYLGYLKESDDKIKTKQLTQVFKGYISKFEKIIQNGSMSVVIYGMDGLMWLMSNLKTELKKNKTKFSAVMNELLGKYSSKLKKSVSIKGEVACGSDIYQDNESDFDFLKRICEKIGCLIFVSNGKCFVSPPSGINNGKQLTVQYDKTHIYYVKTAVDVLGIPKKVTVVGIDSKDYNKQVKSQIQKVSGALGKGKELNALSSNITANNEIIIIDNTVASANEAKSYAESILELKELKAVETEIKCIGYPEFLLGQKITLKKFGDPTDNNYIITELEHRFEQDSEGVPQYETRMILNANKVNLQKK